MIPYPIEPITAPLLDTFSWMIILGLIVPLILLAVSFFTACKRFVLFTPLALLLALGVFLLSPVVPAVIKFQNPKTGETQAYVDIPPNTENTQSIIAKTYGYTLFKTKTPMYNMPHYSEGTYLTPQGKAMNCNIVSKPFNPDIIGYEMAFICNGKEPNRI